MRLRRSACSAKAALAWALFFGSRAVAFSQGPQPGFNPPPSPVNAPLGEIARHPGDGEGAFKTASYRDLFAEQGHSPAESNWSVDSSWWRKDPQETVLSNRIQKFLAGQGISTFADRYQIDGKPLSTRHSVGMVAATKVGGLAATPGADEKAFVEELWRTPIPVGDQRNFDGMLYIMSMLHCSGNFRIWMPK